jgi:hypothetical protein
LWRALINIGTHRRVIRFLKLPPFRAILIGNPRFAYKYLAPHYLSRRFTLAQRATCFLHHHQRLFDALPERWLNQLLQSGLIVHEFDSAGPRLCLTMGLSRLGDKEGELSLNFEIDGEIVFVISFTLVPGSVVQSQAPEVILLTRIQGTPRAYPQIKKASSLLCDIGLNALLFAALQGVAAAFSIDEIVAVAAVDQSAYSEEFAAHFVKSYDSFYTEAGLTRVASGFFVGRIPIAKPLELVRRSHRQRTRLQRELKLNTQEACYRFVNGVIAGSVAESCMPRDPVPERPGPSEVLTGHSAPSVPDDDSRVSLA